MDNIVISGGSFIGMTLGCLLGKLGYNITIVESSDGEFKRNSKLFALNITSAALYKEIGIFDVIKKHGQQITKINVSEGDNNFFTFYPEKLELSHFGYMIWEKILYNALKQEIKKYDNIKFLYNERISKINAKNLILKQKSLKYDLLVIAEGRNSSSRNLLKIDTLDYNYQEVAIVFSIKHEIEHKGVAIEKFFDHGPFAILPTKNQYESAIVWTEKERVAETLLKLSLKEFEAIVSERIGNVFGAIKVTEPKAFPLKLTFSKKNIYQNNIVLIGDADRSIHPLAGQGLNLGLRDVISLFNLIKTRKNLGLHINSLTMLEQYRQKRSFDSLCLISFTHILSILFSSDNIVLKKVKSSAFNLIAKIPWIQGLFSKYATGLSNVNKLCSQVKK